jgi:hypothetical protein
MNFLLTKNGNEQTPEVPEAPEGTRARSSGYNFVVVVVIVCSKRKKRKMGEISSNGLLESHRQTDLCPGGLKPVCFLKPGK